MITICVQLDAEPTRRTVMIVPNENTSAIYYIEAIPHTHTHSPFDEIVAIRIQSIDGCRPPTFGHDDYGCADC